MMNNLNPKVRIVGDGNCLFRCFAYFIYNDQEKYRQIRLKIVKNVVKNWSMYAPFVIIDELSSEKVSKQDYRNYMSKNSIFGGEVEIVSFVNLFQVYVIIQREGSIIQEFGQLNNRNKLILLLSGVIDRGHYDILDCKNLYYKKDYKSYCNKQYYLKKKTLLTRKDL